MHIGRNFWNLDTVSALIFCCFGCDTCWVAGISLFASESLVEQSLVF